MATNVLARARRITLEPLLATAYSLMVNTVVVSVLGVAFWIVAARLFPSEEVGRDSVLITSIISLAAVCNLNMGNTVARFLPQVRDPGRALARAYIASMSVALCLGTVFVLVASRLVDDLSALTDTPLLGVGFVLFTAVWCVFSVQDAALAAMRRSVWVPVENGTYALLKLAALPLIAAVGVGHGVFQAWVLPLALVVVPVNAFLFWRVMPEHRRTRAETVSPLRHGRGALIRFLGLDYAAMVFAGVTWTVLPLLVLALVGSSESAYFYVAFITVHALELMAAGGGTSVLVESAFAEERLRAHLQVMVRRLLPLVLAGAAVVVVAAPLILRVFGSDYADGGTTLLRLLGASVLFRCVIVLFQVLERSRRRGVALLVADAATAALVIGLAAGLAPAWGLTGVGVAWLAGNGAVALAVLPRILLFMRE